jgi:hypothetical protein
MGDFYLWLLFIAQLHDFESKPESKGSGIVSLQALIEFQNGLSLTSQQSV